MIRRNIAFIFLVAAVPVMALTAGFGSLLIARAEEWHPEQWCVCCTVR